jgi:arabinose-5-phosphate isomerase
MSYPDRVASKELKEIRQIGLGIIHQELAALKGIADRLDHGFEDAVALLMARSHGRVVVSGMGKAGFVAMKIAATLSSIGFPAFYLHPADAVHGDLGRCSKDDTVILLSNSGETPEVIKILPLLARRGIPIVAMTASRESSLGKHSAVCIELGRIPEAGALALAPTSTTTVMLVVGDALAMTLVELTGFSKEEFALFHPGGELGRKLMVVSDLMRTGSSTCVVLQTMDAKTVVHAITATPGRPGAAAVINSDGLLVGIFTDGNLRRCLDEGTDFLSQPISSVMSPGPVTVRPNQLAEDVSFIMKEKAIDQVIVVDDSSRPIGLVDVQDLLARGFV